MLKDIVVDSDLIVIVCSAGALDEDESDGEGGELGGSTIVTPTGETLNANERHQLRHRELFLSRQIETLPATHIRGKCTVTLLNETELLLAYLNKDVSINDIAFLTY